MKPIEKFYYDVGKAKGRIETFNERFDLDEALELEIKYISNLLESNEFFNFGPDPDNGKTNLASSL